jgi:hypothetical protein
MAKIDWAKTISASRLALVETSQEVAGVLKAEEPPSTCPWCGGAASGASKDPVGLWTWDCKDGCNP